MKKEHDLGEGRTSFTAVGEGIEPNAVLNISLSYNFLLLHRQI